MKFALRFHNAYRSLNFAAVFAVAMTGLVQAEEAGDPDKGAKVYKKCKACHTVDDKAKNKSGPALWSIVGRPIATVEKFKYSKALKALDGQVWSVENLDAYLAKPKEFVPGTKMTFAGLKKEKDRVNLIAYLALQSDTPVEPETPSEQTASDEGGQEVVEIDPVPYPEGVTYHNPPARSDKEAAEIAARVAALTAAALDYERARYHPLHFPPAAQQASNEECLVCHQEILDHKPLEASPAGVPADQTYAWYQTLDTYAGAQESFHYRHLESDFAKEVMNLECNFCHKGNDPREESPDMVPTRVTLSSEPNPEFTLRKMVNPSETCLRCHGAFPDPEIMGLEADWPEARVDMEYPEAPNGCLSCHAESFRTVRHGVTYLNAENIEALARAGSSDTCYGCHGGRSWYRVTYPYPRHAWPDMDTEVPDWAAERTTASDPEYALPEAD